MFITKDGHQNYQNFLSEFLQRKTVTDPTQMEKKKVNRKMELSLGGIIDERTRWGGWRQRKVKENDRRSADLSQGYSREQHKISLLEIRSNKHMQEGQQNYIRSIIFQKLLKDSCFYCLMHPASVKEMYSLKFLKQWVHFWSQGCVA